MPNDAKDGSLSDAAVRVAGRICDGSSGEARPRETPTIASIEPFVLTSAMGGDCTDGSWIPSGMGYGSSISPGACCRSAVEISDGARNGWFAAFRPGSFVKSACPGLCTIAAVSAKCSPYARSDTND